MFMVYVVQKAKELEYREDVRAAEAAAMPRRALGQSPVRPLRLGANPLFRLGRLLMRIDMRLPRHGAQANMARPADTG